MTGQPKRFRQDINNLSRRLLNNPSKTPQASFASVKTNVLFYKLKTIAYQKEYKYLFNISWWSQRFWKNIHQSEKSDFFFLESMHPIKSDKKLTAYQNTNIIHTIKHNGGGLETPDLEYLSVSKLKRMRTGVVQQDND